MAATHSFSNFFAHSVPKKSKRAKDSGETSSFGLDSLVGSADYSGRETPSWCFASVLFRVFFFWSQLFCALCECWAHVPKGSTSFPVPSAHQSPNWRAGVTGVDVLCLLYFCTYMCPRFVQYIYTSLLLKWRSISQSPHSNGALFWPDTYLSHPAWQRVHRHHQWTSVANCSSPIVAKQFIAQHGKQFAVYEVRLRDKVISKCNPESRWWLSMVNLITLNSWNSSSRTDKIVYIGSVAAEDS